MRTREELCRLKRQFKSALRAAQEMGMGESAQVACIVASLDLLEWVLGNPSEIDQLVKDFAEVERQAKSRSQSATN